MMPTSTTPLPLHAPNTRTRQAYAQHSSTPVADLLTLLEDPATAVKFTAYDRLAETGQLPVGTAERFLHSPHWQVRASLLEYADWATRPTQPRLTLTADHIASLAHEPTFHVMYALVTHPDASRHRHLIQPILERQGRTSLEELLLWGELTQEEWEAVATGQEWHKINVLREREDTSTGPIRRERLRWQRALVDAQRGSAYDDQPGDISVQRQIELASSPYPCIRLALAARHTLSRDAAEVLMHDPLPEVRAHVAINRSTSDDLTVQIADDLLQSTDLNPIAKALLLNKVPFTTAQIDLLLDRWSVEDLAISNKGRNSPLDYTQKPSRYQLTAQQARRMFARLEHHRSGRSWFLTSAILPDEFWLELLHHPFKAVRVIAIHRVPSTALDVAHLLRHGSPPEVRALLTCGSDEHQERMRTRAQRSRRQTVQRVLAKLTHQDEAEVQEPPHPGTAWLWAVIAPVSCPACHATTQQVLHANRHAYCQLAPDDLAHEQTAARVPGYHRVGEGWESCCTTCNAILPQNRDIFYWPDERLEAFTVDTSRPPLCPVLQSPVTRHLDRGHVKDGRIQPQEEAAIW